MQHIPPNERGALDSRSGYVAERGREYLELHPRAKAESGGPLPAAPALCAACHAACERVLRALAESNTALATLLSAEAASSSSSSEPTQPSPRGPMPLGGTTFSASMIRIHRYTVATDNPPHRDLGLLTIAPRASVPGLVIQEYSTNEWIHIEECMGEDEAILFAGSTLTELGGPSALPHKVIRATGHRLSAPYFCRASPHIPLPLPAAAVADGGAPSKDGGDAESGATVAQFVAQLNEDRKAIISAHALEKRQQQQQQQQLPPPPPVRSDLPMAVAVPLVATTETPTAATATASKPASATKGNTSGAPSRVRACFHRIDTDTDGRIVLEELLNGFAHEFSQSVAVMKENGHSNGNGNGSGIPSSLLPSRVRTALTKLFDECAIGDHAFPTPYVDKMRFNLLYAETLFRLHDDDDDGLLNYSQAQAALQFLVKKPVGGGRKPEVPFACPADAVNPETGEIAVPKEWFARLYRTMP